jgi:cytochrome c556
MKLFTKIAVTSVLTVLATGVIAHTEHAPTPLNQAQKATELRQSIFSLLGSNMGPLGGMARGKIAFDADKVGKHALRINQLSKMIADYSRTNTSGHKIETEALDKIWEQPEAFAKRINDLTLASANLQKAAATGNEGAMKKAISGVGKTCGGCHDDFKVE